VMLYFARRVTSTCHLTAGGGGVTAACSVSAIPFPALPLLIFCRVTRQ
jgi:hypothetical protein